MLANIAIAIVIIIGINAAFFVLTNRRLR